MVGWQPYGLGPVVLPPLPELNGPVYPAGTRTVVVVTISDTVTEQTPPVLVGAKAFDEVGEDGVGGSETRTALNVVLSLDYDGQ